MKPLLVAFLLSTGLAQAATPIPIEDLVRPPQMTWVALSPDGRHAATIVSDGTHRGLLLTNLETNEIKAIRGKRTFNPDAIHWLGNQHLVVSASSIDSAGIRVFVTALDDLDNLREIVGRGHVASIPHDRPGTILFRSGNFYSGDNIGARFSFKPTPFEADATPAMSGNARTHKFTDYPKLPDGEIAGYSITSSGELALGLTHSDGHYRIHLYSPEADAWTTLPLDYNRHRPMGIENDRRRIWVAEDHPESGFSLRLYHADTNTFDDPVYTDPLYDIEDGRLIFSESDGSLAGLIYTQRRTKTVWFNKAFANLQVGIDQSRPDTDNILIAQDRTGTKFAFRAQSDRQPGGYFVADMKAQKIIPLGRQTPWFDPAQLQPTRPFSCKTRDDARIEGYLTLPAGAAKDSPVPLVVIAHDNPRSRVNWTYDRDTQFLANRGYAVMQINYRGSSGYRIPDKSIWDFDQMCNDIADATRAILKTGLFQSDHVAAMGTGAGAYLALATAAREPDLYRCLVSIHGVFEWRDLIKNYRNFHYGEHGGYERLSALIGVPGKDRERFAQLSLFTHADRITAPLFIAHGNTNDAWYISAPHAKNFAQQHQDKGRSVTTFFADYSADDLYERDQLDDYYRTLETFLATNLK
ncbi:MAG: S9 family peptidase [Cephaloticoccus sp.]|nr:S9 family peptidase [Cephaloticoccus sp.]